MKTLALGLLAAAILPAHAEVTTKLIAKDLKLPVWAGMPKKTSGKLWVIEQIGKVWILDLKTGEKSAQPFLDVTSLMPKKRSTEEGLLGLAFAPDFEKSGRFYINYTDNEKQTRVVRYTSKDKVTTDVATGEDILVYPSIRTNHNGGWLDFGPDGFLYIGNGDGGSQNDPDNLAQNLDSMLGKILRIDVSPEKGYTVPKDNPFVGKPNAKPEVYAYGLRNPWRCSFDRKTGDLWIGDVGQDKWEEIDFVPAGKGKGANFGWRLREGAIATPKAGVGGEAPAGAIEPIYVYEHGSAPNQGLSVTGGYVYRGPIKELQGRYIFADFQMSRLWSFKQQGGKAADFTDMTATLQPTGGQLNLISSFAEDNDGNLFVLSLMGSIYQVVEK